MSVVEEHAYNVGRVLFLSLSVGESHPPPPSELLCRIVLVRICRGDAVVLLGVGAGIW